MGVVALDRTGRVIARNHVARSILGKRDGLQLAHDRLVVPSPSESAKLRALIARACSPVEGGDSPEGGSLQVSQSPPRRPLALLVAPLRLTGQADRHDEPAAVVFISDPDRGTETWREMLTRMYALTPAEAEVAFLILRGARVDEIARSRRTSVNTARTHLKRIFEKLGANTQSDVVRVLLTGTAPFAVRESVVETEQTWRRRAG
jgi:DNA-binding CsgD family transcriptional regulator